MRERERESVRARLFLHVCVCVGGTSVCMCAMFPICTFPLPMLLFQRLTPFHKPSKSKRAICHANVATVERYQH